jgi:hypothetical protein
MYVMPSASLRIVDTDEPFPVQDDEDDDIPHSNLARRSGASFLLLD